MDLQLDFRHSKAIKSYQTKPRRVEAILLDDSNLEEAARWCGGDLSSVQNHDEGIVKTIKIPTTAGPLQARPGEYLVKNNETGKFSIMARAEFEAEGFYEVGLRQDGPIPRSGGQISKETGPIAINEPKIGGFSVGDRYMNHAGYTG